MGIVKIPGQLAPNGQFPVVDGNDIKGGFYLVDTLAERDAIGMANRKIGMPCYVIDTNMYYRLKDGITNDCWDDWDLDNNGIIINLGGSAVKRDIIIDVDHTHDNIHCTVLKDDEGNKFHTETNTDLVLAPRDKTLTELLTYMLDKIEYENDMPVEIIKLNNNFIVLKTNHSKQIKVDIIPKDHTERIVWQVGDKSIITFDEKTKTITALKPGVTYLKAYSSHTKKADVCSIIVSNENQDSLEVINGLQCYLNQSNAGDKTIWKDSTENLNNAELIGVNKTDWTSDFLAIKEGAYLKLPNTLLSTESFTVEIVADMLFQQGLVKKILCKKNNYEDMLFQLNSRLISFGSKGVIKTIQDLSYIKGVNVYGIVFDKILKTVSIYINGRLFDTITLERNEEFGLSNFSELLIASNGKNDSSSSMNIQAIKIFDRILTDEELLNDAEYLIGFSDGLLNNNKKYCCSLGKWSQENIPSNIIDNDYVKSYKYNELKDNTKYRIILINSNYSGAAISHLYDINKNVINVSKDYIVFNNGVAEIMSNSTYINFYFKNTVVNSNIYYIIEEVKEI